MPRIHRNWIVTRTKDKLSIPFSEAQLHDLSRSLSKAAILHMKQSIAEHADDLEPGQACELVFSLHRIFIWREQEQFLIAIRPILDDSCEEQLAHSSDTPSFIAESDAMKRIMGIIQKVSYVDSTVLLLGHSGVGKGAIARLIHQSSKRASETFLSINCGAIPESLMEAELFGYEAGSFTGGHKNGKKGLFEAAHNGTIFLDEIGELSYALQVKLLEVLQEKQIRRVGGTENIPVHVRIIAATNQDLAQLVANKKFREDLYYRLHVVPIEIPPLRERRDDILPLLRFFLQKYTTLYQKEKRLLPETAELLIRYEWPGNVRELENLIERLVITTEGRDIRIDDLPSAIRQITAPARPVNSAHKQLSLKEAKKRLEKEMILEAYRQYKSSYKAAEVLGVDQSTIAKKLKEYRANGW